MNTSELKWISVEDNLPDVNTRVLCYSSDLESVYIALYDSRGEFSVNIVEHYPGVTHWIPLPQKPENQQHKRIKPEPFECWVNVYPDQHIGGAYTTEEAAIFHTLPEARTIHMREVSE